MKVEKLSKGKNKKIILFITIIVLAIGIIYITNSKAKYQVTKSVQIVNGNVNYSLADLNVLALSVQSAKGSNTYNPTDTVPTGDYEVNTTKSYCTIGSSTAQLKNIPMEYKDNKVYIGITKKGTKCYVFLDYAIAASEKTLGNLKLTLSSSGCPAYSAPTISDIEASQKLLCKGKDYDGDTYYFRGSVANNWVKMGSTYWRIIRINGDGTIRLIYNGTSAGATGTAANYGSNAAFNSAYSEAEYVGLKYTLGSRNGHDTASNMFNTLNTFYNNNFGSGKSLASYASKLDINAKFCGDRTSTTSFATSTDNTGGTGRTYTYYGAYIRVYRTEKPIFTCPDEDNDLYARRGLVQGNRALTNPVGLITADEVVYAGGLTTDNKNYWLYTGADYWTMSPCSLDGSYNARVFYVNSNGCLNSNPVYNTYGVRPVINLKADTKFTGSGTTGSPFVVQL